MAVIKESSKPPDNRDQLPFKRFFQNYFGYKFIFFARGFVELARHDFHRNNITLQTLTLARLAPDKKY